MGGRSAWSRSECGGILARLGSVSALALLVTACSDKPQAHTFTSQGTRIVASVVQQEGQPALQIRFRPREGVLIQSQPGIRIIPASPTVEWLQPMPHVHEAETTYFAAPPVVILPFRGTEPIDLEVEYAYCSNGSQCFRTSTRIAVPQRRS
ncbi:hypothetical protein BH23GEM9_BH23GEM9_00380 [soil metagenome]